MNRSNSKPEVEFQYGSDLTETICDEIGQIGELSVTLMWLTTDSWSSLSLHM